jgi:PASTA domain
MKRTALTVAVAVLLMLVPAAQATSRVQVPRVHGLTLASAKRTLVRHYLRVGRITYTLRAPVAVGRVQSVAPRAGSRVRRGARIGLTVRQAVAARADAPPSRAAVPASPAGSSTTLPPPPAGWVAPALPTIGAPPSILGVGHVPGCLYGADPVPTLARYPGTTVMRVIVSPYYGAGGTSGEAAPCLVAAIAAGYRVELVIQWADGWSDQQVADFFTVELGHYARFAWAVAIGNEEEIGVPAPESIPAGYAERWRIAAPIVRAAAPDALLVAGEISPWGLDFLKQAWVDGLPGAQVIAVHAYQTQGVFSIPALEAWAAQIGLPVWDTEGMAGPGAWVPDYTLMASQLLGVQAGFVWLG